MTPHPGMEWGEPILAQEPLTGWPTLGSPSSAKMGIDLGERIDSQKSLVKKMGHLGRG